MAGLELNSIGPGEMAAAIKVAQSEYARETPIKILPARLPGQPDEFDKAG